MILLDTNAVLYSQASHPRMRAIEALPGPHAISPATVLELTLLMEAGRLNAYSPRSLDDFIDDPRWIVDDPPSVEWFDAARELSWTLDPFDRLIVGHARYRGWRLATSDSRIVKALGPRYAIEV